MTRRDFLRAASAGAAACALPAAARPAARSAAGKRPPNIVLIMADDMGYGDPKCYNPASRTPTPNIDGLAGQGMRFTDAHAPGAWCVPSRYGLLTGRYPMRIRFDLNHSLIEPERMTIASLLKRAGYATACVGKWHLGLEGGAADRDFAKPIQGGPLDRGFDRFFGLHASLDIPPYYYIRDRGVEAAPTETIGDSRSEGWTRIQGAFWRGGKIAPGFSHDQVLPRFATESLAFLADRRKTAPDKPFFLYLPLAAPHTPWLPTGTFEGKTKASMYNDFVHQVDAVVGQVLDALDKLGQADNTLVIFTSDNGPVWYPMDTRKYGHNPTAPLRGIKADAWEGGHRMPFIARWPGRVKPRTTCDAMICFTDMLATFAAIVGRKLPADAGEDSVNILPLLLGEKTDKPPRTTLVIERRVIRDGPWKLILGRPDSGISRLGLPPAERKRFEKTNGCLYNLADDPAEQNDLYARRPQIVARLKTLMARYQKEGRSTPAP